MLLSLHRRPPAAKQRRRELTFSISAALITALLLGLWFNSTRPMSVVAAAILTFMFPELLALVLIGSGLAVWQYHFRK